MFEIATDFTCEDFMPDSYGQAHSAAWLSYERGVK